MAAVADSQCGMRVSNSAASPGPSVTSCSRIMSRKRPEMSSPAVRYESFKETAYLLRHPANARRLLGSIELQYNQAEEAVRSTAA